MYLAETAEQQALRKELREYFAALLTPEVRAELGESGEGTSSPYVFSQSFICQSSTSPPLAAPLADAGETFDCKDLISDFIGII
jgi:hypothetical protein